ncbi:MAG: radical SAM protein [Ignisphaera sp.]
MYRGYLLNLNPPLGLLYLGTKMKEVSEVQIIDCEASQFTYDKIISYVHRFKPDLIGLTSTSWSYYSVEKLVPILKKVFPKIKVVLGGPHVTVIGEEALKTGADLVVLGEGENVADKLFTETGIIQGTRVEDFNFQIDRSLLLPPYNRGYIGNAPRYGSPETVVLWSRGCPHKCVFCCNPIFQGKRTIFRTKESIIEELETLKRDGIKGIFVYDDELVGMNKEQTNWLKDILQEIIERKLIFDFKCQGRCNPRVIDEELLELMKKAGFRCVMLGCESGSDKVLKAIRKGITVQDIKDTVKMIHNAGIEVWAFFMVGNLEETKEDIELTKQLILELKPYTNYFQVTCTTPWQGSELYNIAKSKNWIEIEDLSKYDGATAVMHTDWMTKEEMQIYREELLKYVSQ